MNVTSARDDISPATARLVWVRNSANIYYEEEFKGNALRIPPKGEKKVLMPIIEARRFLAQPNGKLYEEDNEGRVINIGKPLFTTELSEKEILKHDPQRLDPEFRKKLEKEEKTVASRQTVIGLEKKADLIESLEHEEKEA